MGELTLWNDNVPLSNTITNKRQQFKCAPTDTERWLTTALLWQDESQRHSKIGQWKTKFPRDDLLTLNYCKWRFESPKSIKPDPRISHGIVHLFHGSYVAFQPWQLENLSMHFYSTAIHKKENNSPECHEMLNYPIICPYTVTKLEIPVAKNNDFIKHRGTLKTIKFTFTFSRPLLKCYIHRSDTMSWKCIINSICY